MTQTHESTLAEASGRFVIGKDLPVHRLGFGAMRITGRGIWGDPSDREEAKRVLKRAIELGVNFIDTADAYGPNVSEEIIAEALHPYPEGLVIATKGGLMRGGPDNWYPNGRPEHLREALEASLRRLQLERIDVYQFHRPDPAVPFAESVGTLADLQREGKIRHVGLSNVTTRQLEAAQQITEIVSVQNRYNLTDRDSEDVLQMCRRDEIGFIPWGPLGSGSQQEIDTVARKHHASPHQIALAWLLQHSPVMLPIPGTSSVKHLEENMESAHIKLNRDDLATLDSLRGR